MLAITRAISPVDFGLAFGIKERQIAAPRAFKAYCSPANCSLAQMAAMGCERELCEEIERAHILAVALEGLVLCQTSPSIPPATAQQPSGSLCRPCLLAQAAEDADLGHIRQ